MNFIISATTDVGITKSTNQDSLTVKLINTCQGRMVLAVLCDGMGGLEKGEVASAAVVRAFEQWMMQSLPQLCTAPLADPVLREQWQSLILDQNRRIQAYGARHGVRLGTTVTVMLLTQSRYYVLNVGDSRAYELTDGLQLLTQDHTLVAREVALGRLTEEQARTDRRRSVLLQCVGASEQVYPDMFFGEVKSNAVYMLCSDGFRHEISDEEIYAHFRPELMLDSYRMDTSSRELIEINKRRGERDNISVMLIRTF